MFLKDWLLVGLIWFGMPAPVQADEVTISCQGQAMQGGLLLCDAPAGSTLSVSGPDGEMRR